jgi:hypothetical protein
MWGLTHKSGKHTGGGGVGEIRNNKISAFCSSVRKLKGNEENGVHMFPIESPQEDKRSELL